MKLNGPIEGIFFAVGWTLLRPASMSWIFIDKLTDIVDKNILSSIPQDRRSAAYGRAAKYLDANHLVMSMDEELSVYKKFYALLAEGLPELGVSQQQIDEIAYSKVFDMENYVYYDDAVSTLDALRGRYKLGIISDTWPSIESVLKYGGIEGYFDTKTYSYYFGKYKPDRRLYLHELDQMGLPPGHTVFIDDWEKNLAGAAECGIQPVLITAKPDTVNSGKYPSIGRLSELLEMLPD